MGNNFGGIKRAISEEYERVRALDKDDRQYIVLDQVLEIENSKWDSYPIDFTHVGTLFVLDKQKNGKFSIFDFMQFAEICRKREEMQVRHDFKTNIQAYFTLCMWSTVSKPDGEEAFVTWGSNLLAVNAMSGSKAVRKYPEYPAKQFYSEETVKTLYKILAIRQSYGIEWRQFSVLMQQMGEEKGLTKPDDKLEYIHEDVLRQFLASFIKGFVNLMLELGFDPKLEVA